ncbi:MAG: MFS transporter, partial [Candidatus Hodarchaeota archaeon]
MVKKETIIIFMGFLLVFLATIATSIVIPFFMIINRDLGIDHVGIIEAFHVIMATLSLLVWGVCADRYDRRSILFLSTALWTGSALLLSILPAHLVIYFFFRGVMGLGVGAALPLIYSVLGDSVRMEERGKFSSGLSVAVISGAGSGIILGTIFENFGWKNAFFFLSLAGIIIISPLLLYKVPKRGAQEPELLSSDGLIDYN